VKTLLAVLAALAALKYLTDPSRDPLGELRRRGAL